MLLKISAGGSLSVCQTTTKQCCTETYIRTVNSSAMELVRGELQAQLLEVADRVKEINDRILLCKLW